MHLNPICIGFKIFFFKKIIYPAYKLTRAILASVSSLEQDVKIIKNKNYVDCKIIFTKLFICGHYFYFYMCMQYMCFLCYFISSLN